MPDNHDHIFNKPVLVSIGPVNGIPKAFAAWQCTCTKWRAFEYGTRDDMIEFLKEVKEKRNT